MAEDSRNCWNPFTETLPRENMRAIQPKNFRNLVEYSQNNSILFQDRLKGANPEDIRTQGYVIENEEAVEDLFGITAPITDYSRQVGAALDIA